MKIEMTKLLWFFGMTFTSNPVTLLTLKGHKTIFLLSSPTPVDSFQIYHELFDDYMN